MFCCVAFRSLSLLYISCIMTTAGFVVCLFVVFLSRCPTREQNREYVSYLLKVLYLEANVRKTELYNYSVDVLPL